MKKYLIGLVCCMVLGITGCNSDYTPQDKTNKYQLSDNLSDCSVTELRGSNENDIIVVRCPLSSTTTAYSENCGKNCTRHLNNALIDENKKKVYIEVDGVKYEKVEGVK